MTVINNIVYFIIILIILFAIGFGAYMIYDYTKYKNDLNNSLNISTNDINYNFTISSSNLQNIHSVTASNITDIENNIKNISYLTDYSSNTSNIITKRIDNHLIDNENTFFNFNSNLNRYFDFKDGDTSISSSSNINNKIFDYIFGTDLPNMNLITKTTAIAGLTINSDINKELKICSQPDNCIKMITDVNGNFNILSDGTKNILFKNNQNNTMLNINTLNNEIYMGGDTPKNSAMFVKNNEVYLKNLYIVDDSAELKSTVINYNTYNSRNYEINTNIIINNAVTNTNDTDVISSTVFIILTFPGSITITDKRKIIINTNEFLINNSLHMIAQDYILYKQLTTENEKDPNHLYYYISFNDNNTNSVDDKEIIKSSLSNILNVSVKPIFSISFSGTNPVDIPKGLQIILHIKYTGANITILSNDTVNFNIKTLSEFV